MAMLMETPIEYEIQKLIKKRGMIFEEWANLVKKNDREIEISGACPTLDIQKAEKLLHQHNSLRGEIMRLFQKADGSGMAFYFTEL